MGFKFVGKCLGFHVPENDAESQLLMIRRRPLWKLICLLLVASPASQRGIATITRQSFFFGFVCLTTGSSLSSCRFSNATREMTRQNTNNSGLNRSETLRFIFGVFVMFHHLFRFKHIIVSKPCCASGDKSFEHTCILFDRAALLPPSLGEEVGWHASTNRVISWRPTGKRLRPENCFIDWSMKRRK